MEKDAEFEHHNCGLYVADTLIEESGLQPVISLYGDASPLVAEYMGPLLIRQTGFKIIHAFHNDRFNVCLYRKTVYIDNSNELLPYTAYRSAPINADCQIRKTLIKSVTTFHIVVNGIVYDLGYSCHNREYRLTALSEAYSGPAIDAIHGYLCRYPWLDVGYDAEGNVLEEDNSDITRIFTTSAGNNLMVGFDVFPVAFRHELVYDEHNNLTLDYKEDIHPFPPSSDGIYPQVKGRKWLLFGTDGKMKANITPPQVTEGGVTKNVNRINGLCMISREA